jgi:hypothetical protein
VATWTHLDFVDALRRWTTEIVGTGERSRFPDASAGDDVRHWFEDGADVLVRTLSDADPARACWTMATPRNVGFWSRRQAHEAMIHRWDLATAIGLRADLDAASCRRWVLEGDGTTTNHDSADVAATVTGDAVPLLLLVWQRIDLTESPARVDGDSAAARRVLGAHLTP